MEKSARSTATRPFRTLWELLTREVSSAALERFVRDEVPGAYSFFRRNLRDEELPKGSIRRSLKISWLFFLLFLEKLTPIRRLLFGLSLVLFFGGRFNNNDDLSLIAFAILLLVLVLEVADKLLTKGELVVAREIQLSLLPSELVAPSGFQAAASTEVANSVGGDYYDTIPVSDGAVIYALADVSGKGISAALYTTTVQTALRLYAETTDEPSDLLTRIDAYMTGRMKRMYFLTMVLVRVDRKGHVRVARAGHPKAIHVSSRERKASSIEASGMAIGMKGADEGGLERSRFGTGRCVMEKGDLVVCLSDGVLETANPSGEEYGEKRLHALLAMHAENGPDAIRDRLLSDLREFRQGHDLRDDSTFLIVKRLA